MASDIAAVDMSGHAVIILAAGLGRRFGGTLHKSLVPLQFGEGSLHRLLRQLIRLERDGDVVVVTGHRADAVSQAVRALLPGARCVFNPQYANGSLLTSVTVGLDALVVHPSATGAWVLFADTIYRTPALKALLVPPVDTITVASQPPGATTDQPVGLRLAPGHRNLLDAIGPEVVSRDGVMAPAVFWPRASWDSVTDAAARGISAQWQVVAQEKQRTPVRVVSLGSNQLGDFDTAEELDRHRRDLIGVDAADYFRRNISKDERNLEGPDRAEGDRFTKICESEQDAWIECDALRHLASATPEPIVPAVLELAGRRLTLEFVPGIRLYDLLRLLGDVAATSESAGVAADAAAQTLMRRSLERLIAMQRVLMAWPLRADRPPYPFDVQVTRLLVTLGHLLELPPLSPAEQRELSDLATVWNDHDAVVPFRDATPKNILVAIPALAPGRTTSDHERLASLMAWLKDAEAPKSVRLVDYDFTAVRHLTAPEDDVVSLLAHQGSVRHGRRLLAARDTAARNGLAAICGIPPTVVASFGMDPQRAARAFLVRYLRFGGRKLVYRLVNPAAFAVRFRHDAPQYYFDVLPDVLKDLDPDFGRRWPLILSRLTLLAQTVGGVPPWNPNEAAADFYQNRLGRRIRYWQESPTERVEVDVAGGSGT